VRWQQHKEIITLNGETVQCLILSMYDPESCTSDLVEPRKSRYFDKITKMYNPKNNFIKNPQL